MIRKESLSDLQSIEITRTRETIGLFCPTLCLFTVAGHLNVEKMNVEKIKIFKENNWTGHYTVLYTQYTVFKSTVYSLL